MKNKFRELETVVHIATGKVCIIFYVPKENVKIEATGKTCYYYEEKDTDQGWFRPKDEMEDGRFEKVEV